MVESELAKWGTPAEHAPVDVYGEAANAEQVGADVELAAAHQQWVANVPAWRSTHVANASSLTVSTT